MPRSVAARGRVGRHPRLPIGVNSGILLPNTDDAVWIPFTLGAKLEPYRVVVIDDDPDIAGYVKLVLEKRLGSTVVIATDPGLIREIVAELKPDVVITDIEMPGISGLDLIAEIREEQPDTPVVVMTGHASVDYAVKALRYRANEFLTKPVASAELVDLVTRLANEYRASKLPSRRRQVVLAIGAHPDDAEVGVGGLLAAHAAAGDDVIILTLSKGRRDGGVRRAFEEANAAGAVIGAIVLFEEDIEGADQVHERVERAVAELKPTIVYVHSRHDSRIDHRTVHEATIMATESVNTVACYHGSHGTVKFSPDRFVPIDGFGEAKLEMLAKFAANDTDRPSYLSPDFVVGSARYWSQFGIGRFCEPLEIVRESPLSPVLPPVAVDAVVADAAVGARV